MLKIKVRNDESINFRCKSRGIFDAKPHPNGGYIIYWWYGIGDCFEFVDKFTDLISLANADII